MSHVIPLHALPDELVSHNHVVDTELHPHELEARPRSWLSRNLLSGFTQEPNDFATSMIGKDGFQVCLDVHQFAPSEITVRTVDNTITVEGKHEEREDEHGYISRQFTRRYSMPDGYNIEHLVSQLSSDGVLIIKAPPPHQSTDGSNVRVVPLLHTGPAHLHIGNRPEKREAETKIE